MRRQAKASSAGSTHGTGNGRRTQLALVAAIAVIASLAFGTNAALAAAPTLSVDPGPTAAYTTAAVSGHLDPADNEVFYWFQYVHNPNTESWSDGAAFTHVAGPNTGDEAVAEELTGLKPGTEYKVRLRAFKTDFSGEEWFSEAPYESFTTEPVASPTVVLDSITTHTDTTAEFSGTVDPNAPAGPLSNAAKAAFETSWHFSCNPGCPNLTVPNGTVAAEADAGEQIVSTEASGLEPNTTYEVTIEANNVGGSASDLKSFATDLIPPTVKSGPGASDGKGGYILQGAVNPHNSAITSCEFEYGLTTAYGQSVPCTSNPGAVNKFVEVNAHPTGLTPGAPYHFQIVATNGAGSESSGDATFVPTFVGPAEGCPNEALRAENNSLALPECRAYELVSNPYKEGFAALPSSYTDDGAFSFRSAGNIAGNGLGGPINAYLAMRSPAGWLTNSLSPNGSAYGSANGHASGFLFSTDLRSSIWLMRRSDQPTNLAEFYLRRPDGTFTHIGPAVNPASLPPESPGTTFTGIVQIDGTAASADLSHFLFTVDSSAGFPGDTSHGTHSLYEYVGTGNDRPELVGVDNAGHQISQGETCESGISTDGRVVFFDPGCSGGTPQVWLRINGTTTIEASASECTRTVADPDGACNGPAEANFKGAANDGSRVYFTTTQQLLNGDTDETNDLYACEIPPGTPAPVVPVNPCADLIEVSGPGSEARVERVLNVSEDGSRVYFVAQGALAANLGTNDATAVAGDHNLYVWQKDAAHPAGQTTFVAKLDSNAFDFGTQSTADGRYLLFITPNQLLATDTDNASDVYRYDADTGALLRLSTDTSGTGGNAEGIGAAGIGLPPGRPRSTITADGTAAVFTTSEALSPADTNGTVDVYEWHQGQVSLISSGRPSPSSGSAVPIAWITASGKDIYFMTAAQLTPNDADTNVDVYDARIGGGFSFPQAARCSEEACQPSAAGPPVAPTPATNGPGGEGNVKPRSCPKGKVRKGEKCVKKPHKKTKRANADRRVSR